MVAKYAIDEMLNEKLIIIPGFKMKCANFFSRFLSTKKLAKITYNIHASRLLTNDRLLMTVYENNIIETLRNNGFNLYHYHSQGKSTIDLVIQTRTGKIVPIEMLDNSSSQKSKSLAIAMNKYNLSFAIRFTTENFKERKGIKYIPYYAAFCIKENL